ncbi:AP-4 complex subunit epsilon-1 [Perkinsus chesapeaki]|uniref:AP-4 complex subunit epsilon-1 n=1 Tax=Perkinsus chesapeaki TaxID=330153 RepID=A0A7J6M7S7_PERCH|nr:AP-4 complex subunit epsilon-1 [Perkinsus chesapeaki]
MLGSPDGRGFSSFSSSPLSVRRPSTAPYDTLSTKSSESIFTTTASSTTTAFPTLREEGNAGATAVLGPDIRSDPDIRRLASSLTKLPLGENGRMRVRRMIGQEIRRHPDLRPVVRSIGKLKSASNAALIEMCIVTSTLDEAQRISREYLASKAGKPNRRSVGAGSSSSSAVAFTSPYTRTSEAETCGLSLIERLFADTLSNGVCSKAEDEEAVGGSSSYGNLSTVDKDITDSGSWSSSAAVAAGLAASDLTDTIVLPEDFLYDDEQQELGSSNPPSYIPLVTVGSSVTDFPLDDVVPPRGQREEGNDDLIFNKTISNKDTPNNCFSEADQTRSSTAAAAAGSLPFFRC